MVETFVRAGVRAAAVGRRAPAAPALLERYRLRPDARLEDADGRLSLHVGRWAANVRDLGRSRQEVLRRLDDGWLDDTELAQLAVRFGGEKEIMPCHLLVQALARQGWLTRAIQWGGRDLIEVIPHVIGGRRRPVATLSDPDQRYRLAKHSAIVEINGCFGLRSPDWLHTVVVSDPRLLSAIGQSVSGATAAELGAAAALGGPAAPRTIAGLLEAGILARCGDEEAALRFWDSDELRLHTRSRAGSHTFPIGATYRFREQAPPEPLQKPAPDGEAISLPEFTPPSPSFSAVLDARRSIRDHDDAAPISLAQLSAFLRQTQATAPSGSAGGQEVGSRPYPTAGGICELETYVLVNRCDGLRPGLYWYESTQHALRQIAAQGPMADRMLSYARAASGAARTPQLLLTITSRLYRLAWKYEGLAYSMSLRNSGVLLGQMYMVATALGLAPCALGTSDSAAFAALSGIDALAEPCLADFMLGSKLDTSRETS
jgi:SagB-type dehydrogenase family enzyme